VFHVPSRNKATRLGLVTSDIEAIPVVAQQSFI
jgi:hypothetical protein